ncbi:MAG: hypothetical protein ABSG91_19735, partial [Syntrophobacteraceae bacterium]
EAATRLGPVFLGALILATALSVLSYARALTLCWWGPSKQNGKREPALLATALLGVCAVLLVIGLWPAILVK